MSKRLLRVTDLRYVETDDGPLVKLVGRGDDGERYIREIEGTEPVFWVPEDEFVINDDRIEGVESGYTSYDGKELKKIHTTLPKHTGDLREEFDEHYEADVPYVRRVSVDYGLSGYIRVPRHRRKVHIDEIETGIEEEDIETIDPRVIMADIETLPPSGSKSFSDFTEEASEPVLMITTYDTYEDEYYAITQDPDDEIDPKFVRKWMEKHWDGIEDSDKYTDAKIRLKTCDDEVELLQEFIDHVDEANADLLSGWNWTDFDIQYLVNRFDQFDEVNEHKMADIGYTGGYKKRRLIDGLPSFDMMRAFCGKMSYGEWRSEALDYVSQDQLGIGKVEDIDIRDEWENDKSKLLAYNIIDVQLCVGLDDKHGIHEFFYQIADICGIQIYETMSEMRLVEGFILSRRSEDEILPSTEEKDLDEIAGGLVLSPSDGLREWVAVLDLKSLYPSSIISCNISRETVTDDPHPDVIVPDMPLNEESVPGGEITEDDISWKKENGAQGFTLEKEGVMPKYIKMLFEQRRDMKDIRNEFDTEDERWDVWNNKQRAVKVIMNSFFGVSDNPYFRLSDHGMGGYITGVSRYVTWKGVQIAEEMGYDVAYGDTDSIMIELADPDEDVTEEEVIERGYELEERINEEMNQVADDVGLPEDHPHIDMDELPHDLPDDSNHAWAFEFEKLFRRFIQTGSKKRYAGLIIWKEGQKLDEYKPSITGYEAKRTDIPEIASKTQKKFIKRILGGQGFDEVSEFIAEKAEGIEKQTIPLEKIGIPGVLNKPVDEYPNRPIPRGCEYANEYIGDVHWGEGDEPWVFYVDDTPTMMPNTDVLALPWNVDGLPDGFTLDTGKHIEKHLKQPLKPFLNEMGWKFNELKAGEKTQSVGAFGGGSDDPFSNDDGDDGGTDPFSSSGGQRRSDKDEEDDDDSGGVMSW